MVGPTSNRWLSSLVLGTPVGHDDFVKEQLRSRREKHDVLLNFQAAWLLLTFCAAGRAFFTLTVRPASVESSQPHNHAIWTCLVKTTVRQCLSQPRRW